MHISQETAQALLGSRTSILRDWRARLRATCGHLSPSLVAGRGPLTVCASETLDAVVESLTSQLRIKGALSVDADIDDSARDDIDGASSADTGGIVAGVTDVIGVIDALVLDDGPSSAQTPTKSQLTHDHGPGDQFPSDDIKSVPQSSKRKLNPRGASKRSKADDGLLTEEVESGNKESDAGELPGKQASVETKPLLLNDPGAELTPELNECSLGWTRIGLNWADTNAAIAALSGACCSAAAAAKAASSEDLSILSTFDRLRCVVSGRRAIILEQELATDREEAVMTQHLAGRFLANASHELRTPLTAVLGFAELLLEDTYGKLTVNQRQAVGHIEESAQNLLEIVNNLLDLLHIRAGKLKIQYRPVEFTYLLRNLYSILLPLSARKNVKFRLDIPDDLGVVEADEKIVRHIVYHLLASSLRSTPANGEVILSAERGENTMSVVTLDTALHLPPEAIANMMGPFPLLENSPARGYEGWEIGLPLVRRYIDLHGGNLETESLPDRGTIFRVIFPLRSTLNKADRAGASAPPATPGAPPALP